MRMRQKVIGRTNSRRKKNGGMTMTMTTEEWHWEKKKMDEKLTTKMTHGGEIGEFDLP